VQSGGTIDVMIDRQTITLRPATADDAERIAGLFTDEGYPAGPSDIVERLERFASEHSRVIVADNGGEVLGFVAVHALPRFEHSDRVLRIMALIVDAGVRERGVGRMLMEEAERLGREVGAAFAEVTAGHHRPDARRFYEDLGYDGSVAAYLRKRL
jgi:GNAT superfamily N-acetyltransferase